MVRGLIGKKLGMTSVFTPDGRHAPVTVVQVGPCVVTQIKTETSDGYNALQLGFGEKKPSRVNKPMAGHLKKSESTGFLMLREMPVDQPEEYSLGQTLSIDMFEVGERVDVIGTSKGRGFAGVTKRHGFHLGRKTHGGQCYRIPGSIGSSAWPSRVIKGKRMPGRYGNEQKTIRNLEILDIRPDEHLILLKGAIPGAKSGPIAIKKIKFVK